jgi:hypothetical protein
MAMTPGLLLSLLVVPLAQAEGIAVRPVALQELRTRKLDPQQKNVGLESIWVRTEVAGEPIKHAIKSGNLKVTVARDDAGNDLIGTTGSAQTVQPALRPTTSQERTAGRLDFEIKMKAPARGSRSLTVKGSIDLLVVAERAAVDLKLKAGVEGDLKHADLEAAGIRLRATKTDAVKGGEKMVGLVIEGKDEHLLDVEMLDAAGKALRAGSPLALKTRPADKTRYYPFPDKLPAEYTLRVTVARTSRTLTVPFELTGIELP